MGTFAENYIKADIIFEDDGYYWVDPTNSKKEPVMMEWETPIMQKMADVSVDENDNVLELGFGMGILSDMIQAKKPKTHTIAECHKDIIPKLKEWAKDKPNVIVKETRWIELLKEDTKYESIILDTYADTDRINFCDFAVRKASLNNTKVTWWNPKDTALGFDDYRFTKHSIDVNPPNTQDYYTKNTFNVPLKILAQ